jgi:hypothetical protein
MSITITGGITLSGGGWSVSPPPSNPTAGWFAGGVQFGPGQTIGWVTRITFATDTVSASDRGPLNTQASSLASTGTLTAGWFAGGSGGYNSSIIQRITYATDTATASLRGTLSVDRIQMSSTTDTTTYGWYGGSVNYGGSLVNRITYASDTATTSVRGPLNSSTYYNTATGTSSYGWYAGGGSTTISSIDRITYANDTATATARGPLTLALYSFAGAVTDSTTYGWIAGGRGNTPVFFQAVSTVSRITYANDTVATTDRGPLAAARYKNSGTNSDGVYGWFGGGGYFNPGSGFVAYSNTTRITYANDTVTSTNRGIISNARFFLSGSSGTQ